MTGQLKTVMLMGLLSGVIVLLGGAAGGHGGLIIALVIALGMNVFSYWFSDKLVLKMYRAKEISRDQAPNIFAMVEDLTARAGLPMPKIYQLPQEAPNAFATGRNPKHAAVAVTRGIVRLLSPEELRGVLAHELAHVKNRDILIQTIAGVMASVIMFMASMLRFSAIFGGRDGEGGNPLAMIGLAIIAPIAAMLIQLAISRTREYGADRVGAQMSGTPLALASALEKIHAYAQGAKGARGARNAGFQEGSEATAHMFIVNPFSASKLAGLFSTHPPMEERVARLREMARA